MPLNFTLQKIIPTTVFYATRHQTNSALLMP